MSFISQLYCQIKKNDLQHCSVQIIFFAILCNERSLSAIDIVFKADKVILNSIGGVRQFGAKYITGGNPVW